MNIQIRTPEGLKSVSIMDRDRTFFNSFSVAGEYRDVSGMESVPRVVDVGGISICRQGEAEIIINSQSYRLRRGDMCVVVPGSILQVKGKSDEYEAFTMVASASLFSNGGTPSMTAMYLDIKDTPCISLEREEAETLLALCNGLKEHDQRRDHPFRHEIAQLSTLTILLEIAAIYKKRQPLQQQTYTRKNKLFIEFTQLVAKHYDRHRMLDFYADKLCITPRYLSAVAKEVSGMTAGECIEKIVIMNARILLTTTDMTIQQISDRLNFPNHSFFSKYFKRITGMTPKEYRRIRP